jgi:hypothetical protein
MQGEIRPAQSWLAVAVWAGYDRRKCRPFAPFLGD